MPKGSSCKARGCTSNKTDNPELSFHSFPKNKERFKIWCDLIKRPDLNHSKVITNRMSMRVCSLHFEDRMYMSPNNKSRLIWCAVPKPVTDEDTSVLATSSNLAGLDSKVALASHVEAQERQSSIADSTVLAQPLPLAKGSKKFDWSLALDEDVIIKEESMTDQDNHLDVSAPPSPEADSPTFYIDIKEGIVKHDHAETTDDCAEYSLFLSPSGNASSSDSAGEETGSGHLSQRDRKCLEEINSSISSQSLQDTLAASPSFSNTETPVPKKNLPASFSVISPDSFRETSDEASPSDASQASIFPKVSSEISRDFSSAIKKISSKGVVDVASSSVLSCVKEEPLRPTATVLQNEGQMEKDRSKLQLLEDTIQPDESNTPLSQPAAVTCHSSIFPLLSDTVAHFSSSAATTSSSQSNSSISTAITQPPQEKSIPSLLNVSQSLNSSSSSLGSSHSLTTVDSSLNAGELKLLQVKPSMLDTAEVSDEKEDLLKKLAYDGCGDEHPIVVDEDDVSIVDEREYSECEKDCQCSKCEEGIENVPAGATKPPYQVHRTYSGPIKRQIIKTKGGGKRTFMILNKASLKVLQAKGLIQPLKNYADSQTPPHEALKSKTKVQYNSIHSVDKSPVSLPESSPSFDCTAKNAGSPDKVPFISLSQKLSSSNKTKEPVPLSQDSSQTPVVVTWSATNGTDTPSFTFTIQLPPGSNQPSGTPQTPFQIVTPPVFIGGSQPASSQPSTIVNNIPVNKNGKYPSSLIAKSKIGSDDSHFTVSQSIMSSGPKPKNSICKNTITIDSSNQTVQSPIMSTQFPLVAHESPDGQSQTCQSVMETINDLEGSNECISSGPSSPQMITFDETATNKKPEKKLTPIGFASGPCKIRKGGVKMYRYVHMPDGSTSCTQASKVGPKSSQNVRWVALPTVPISSGQSLTADTLKHVINTSLQQNSQEENHGAGKTPSPCVPVSSHLSASIYEGFPIAPVDQKGLSSVHAVPYKSANKELKKKYARLLNKHRQRYHLLLKKYKALESKFAVVEDAGTPEQVIRDAKNFLSEEHVLFLESQMFLRNRPGTGNRFSKKFMRLMIEYYKRSAAGYRFLRTIFTIPSVKTVQKWLSKPLHIREEEESDPLAIPSQKGESGTLNERESNVEALGYNSRKQITSNREPGSGGRGCYSSAKLPQGRSTPDESDLEEGSSEEYDSEESGLEEMEDEEVMHDNENSRKRLSGQTNQGSNEEEITIEWEEEPWPSVVME